MPSVKALVFTVIAAVTLLFAQHGIDFVVVEDTVQTGTSVITWHFILTNTGSVPDTYALDLSVIQNNAGWFIQHCAAGQCQEPGNILLVELDPADADSAIDVQVFIDTGPDTAILNYLAYSLGDSAQRDSFNLYAISELGVEEQDNSETEHRALTVFPNPFTKLMYISLDVDSRQTLVAHVAIYSISGRLVKAFDPVLCAPSPMHVSWDGTDDDGRAVPEGVYIVRVNGASASGQAKIVKLE